MTQTLRIALAQVDAVLGDVEANLTTTRAVMARARDAAADLVVFPELSLTGYALGHVEDDVARAGRRPGARRARRRRRTGWAA